MEDGNAPSTPLCVGSTKNKSFFLHPVPEFGSRMFYCTENHGPKRTTVKGLQLCVYVWQDMRSWKEGFRTTPIPGKDSYTPTRRTIWTCTQQLKDGNDVFWFKIKISLHGTTNAQTAWGDAVKALTALYFQPPGQMLVDPKRRFLCSSITRLKP